MHLAIIFFNVMYVIACNVFIMAKKYIIIIITIIMLLKDVEMFLVLKYE